MSTIFLTGATGLVGSRLVPRLLAGGHAVRALVRGDVALPAGTTAVRGDLLDPDALRAGLEGADAVVHLAALFRTDDEAAIWRANLDGTRALLEATRGTAPDARFVMTSTGNVYSHDLPRPAREDDPTTAPAAYPASKVAAEGLLRESGLTGATLRLPFVYGDGDGHLTSLGGLVERFGLHPAASFSVAHHRDVAQAVGLALGGALDGRTANVRDDADATVHELAAFGGVELAGSAEPLSNPWSGRMDGALLRGLGFRPEVPTIHAAAREGIL